LWVVQTIAAATAFGCLFRQFVYRRAARAGEWIAILLGLQLVMDGGYSNLDTYISGHVLPRTGLDWQRARWLVAVVALAAVVGGVAAVYSLRRVLPPFLKTIVLTALAGILLWGPLDVVAREAPSLAPYLDARTPTWLFWMYVEARRFAALLPTGLLYGIPATAALRDCWRRTPKNWVWTQTIGFGLGFVLGGSMLMVLYLLRSEVPPDGLNAERLVMPMFLAVTWAASRLIIRNCGEAWHALVT
jgi:hypothetical protein